VIAEDRYVAILDMAEGYIQEFYAGIVKLNAAMDVRRLILDETLEHLNTLQSTSHDDPELEALIAYTHSEYGKYFASLRSANVLDTEQAMVQLNNAIQKFEDLVDNGHTKYGRNLALAHYRISDIKKILEEYDGCLDELDKATPVIEKFVQEYPDNVLGHGLISTIALSRLDVYNKTNRTDEAKEQLDDIVEYRRSMALRSPKDLKLQRNLAIILLRGGKIYFRLGQYDVASDFYQEALAIFTELVALEPENGRAPRDKAFCHYFLAETQIAGVTELDKGFENLNSGLELIRNRCVAYPADADARNDVITYVERFVWLCIKADRFERAGEGCREVLLALQPILEANPDNYALGAIYSKVEEYLSEVVADGSENSE
jgi:tetratricopeptide (TPR) repeat protein